MKSRQMLEALQEALRQRGVSSFFRSDGYIFLDVYAGGEEVAVQVADSDQGRESFAWMGADGRTHTETPAKTLAWLVDWAKVAEASKEQGGEGGVSGT